MRCYIVAAALAFSVCISTTAAAGDAEAGKVKAYTCTGCHGIPGYNNVYPTYNVPKIAGQNYDYIVTALKAYRSGERQHETMSAQASSLTDAEIDNIATWLSGLGGE